MQAERLLKIIFLLMNGTCRTAKELAESCSVSVRTVQRDMDALSLAGIPVFSHRGYGGGVGLLKEFTLDKTYLTEQERADIMDCKLLRARGILTVRSPCTSWRRFFIAERMSGGCGWIFLPGAARVSAGKSLKCSMIQF